MLSGDHPHGNDLCKLNNVQDLELLQLEESVEDTIVELAEESERVSAREVPLLGVVDRNLDVKVWPLVGSHGIWNILQVFAV